MYKEYATPQDFCDVFCGFKENDEVLLAKDVHIKADNGMHIITKGVQAIVKAVSFNEEQYHFPTLFKEDLSKYSGITDANAFVITLSITDNDNTTFDCYGDEIIPNYADLSTALKERKIKTVKSLLWDIGLPLLAIVFIALLGFNILPRAVNDFVKNHVFLIASILAIGYFFWRQVFKSHLPYNERVKEEMIRNIDNGDRCNIDIIKEKCKKKIKFQKARKGKEMI